MSVASAIVPQRNLVGKGEKFTDEKHVFYRAKCAFSLHLNVKVVASNRKENSMACRKKVAHYLQHPRSAVVLNGTSPDTAHSSSALTSLCPRQAPSPALYYRAVLQVFLRDRL